MELAAEIVRLALLAPRPKIRPGQAEFITENRGDGEYASFAGGSLQIVKDLA